jgi:hypothetical protein
LRGARKEERIGRDQKRIGACNNDGRLLPSEIGGEPRQSVVFTLSPTIVQGDVLTLDRVAPGAISKLQGPRHFLDV